MNLWNRLELEWKIVLVAGLLFVAIAWPAQKFYISYITTILEQSNDPQLAPLLRSYLGEKNIGDKITVENSLRRHLQWKAVIPILIREQRQVVLGFSIFLFLFLFFLAMITLKRLTRPLKNLALAVKKIGKGERAQVEHVSGGALGTVENAVIALQEELGILRESARIQGMEAAWKDIARVMAHEIKNPLTPIRLSIDQLDEKVALGEEIAPDRMKKFLGRINGQIDMLERLVNQFRSFSKEPEVNLKAVDAAEVVDGIAHDMTGKIKTKVSGDGLVLADPYLLNQVLLNIWKNALEAGADTINVDFQTVDEYCTFTIQDNGTGIPEKDLETVWLPYVTFKKGGTGLGLPVVKRMVETMHGTVALKSVNEGEKHGLILILRLPIIQED